MIRLFFCIIFFLSNAYAQEASSTQQASSSSAPTFNEKDFYQPYTKILEKYVDLKGFVDYQKLKQRRAELDVFIAGLKGLSPDVYKSWNQNDKLAFWINIYNVLTVKVIIDHYPIVPSATNTLAFPSNSIRQIVGAWTGFKHEVMGRSVTLDEINNTILRNEFNDPRYHFALCLATIGGAKLRREVYLGSLIDAQLTDQSKYFLRDASKFHLDAENKQVLISPIFDWYIADFAKVYPNNPQFKRYTKEMAAVLKFLTLHLASEEAAIITSRPLKVSFLEYNWELNDTSPPPEVKNEL